MRNRLLMTVLSGTFFSAHAGQLPMTPPKADVNQKLSTSYGQLPLSFERNEGQSDRAVRFMSRGQGYTLFLTPTEAVLALRKTEKESAAKPAASAEPLALRMKLVDANPEPIIEGQDVLPGKVNYLKGKDPKQWRTGASTYGKVRYQGVYPGIDLVYYGKQRQLEYDFIVQPGADPKHIRLDFSGADGMRIDAAGDLLLDTKDGELRLQKPVVFQTIAGKRKNVEGRFVLHQSPPDQQNGKANVSQIGIQVAAYDVAHPLVIDPVLAYSSYFGGSGDDWGKGIAVDGAGNAYVTGGTSSSDFPVNPQPPGRKSDVFVFKLSDDGQSIAYSTYLGGSDEDVGNRIAVDGKGNAYVTGYTGSSDFPTVTELYPNFGGTTDAFVFKLSDNGQDVVYSTYLGGTEADGGWGIAVDGKDNVYVMGSTQSTDFPTADSLYPNFGGETDAFVLKLNGDGKSVGYSTYLGGSKSESSGGIAVDGEGNAYVTGQTRSTDFPAVNAKYPNLRGESDAFVSKLSADGQNAVYSTYFGGSKWETDGGIAVDGEGNAYVTGITASSDFPTSVNAKYRHFRGERDAFVFKLSGDGQNVGYSTYFGGKGLDDSTDIAVDSAGNAYVTGSTSSSDFPSVNAAYPKLRGSDDAFVFRLSGDGQNIGYSTYLGGGASDSSVGIAVDGAGSAYVTGVTYSTNFPTVNAQNPKRRGAADVFVAKLPFSPSITLQSPNGGEIWKEGTKQTILWSSRDLAKDKRLLLYVSVDNGINWKKIGSATNGAELKTWTIPKKLYAGKQALLKICLNKTLPLCDISDAAFNIN
ncbi:SBBP repeat-containing protein [Methylomicrobium lacus]|uniref:DUF7948 domain-containing protein n=1 Tax=Methylomicrobium lacus TaxID=136992 RepID=UPI0035A8C3E5